MSYLFVQSLFVFLMYDICDFIPFHYSSFVIALTMRNLVILCLFLAAVFAADQCTVTNPIDCGYPGTFLSILPALIPFSRNWSRSLRR